MLIFTPNLQTSFSPYFRRVYIASKKKKSTLTANIGLPKKHSKDRANREKPDGASKKRKAAALSAEPHQPIAVVHKPPK